MCSLHRKKCRLKQLGKKLHFLALHDTNKTKDYKLTSYSGSSAFYHIMCFLLQLFQCIYICFYFVLANNKNMAEQRYILQTISDQHQKSTTFIFMSRHREVITVWNHNKIQIYVRFYVSLMGIFVSKHNTIQKYLYEKFLCNNL